MIIVHIVKGKGYNFNLFRQIDTSFRLIDQYPSVLIVLQWMDDINVPRIDIGFGRRHRTFPNNDPYPHLVIGHVVGSIVGRNTI